MATIVTHRLIVPDPAERCWLVTADGELPRIETEDRHTADTEYLNAAVLARWGLRCTVREALYHSDVVDGRVQRAHVLELDGSVARGLVWSDAERAMSAADRGAVGRWRAVSARGVVDGREWTRRGWRSEVLPWIAAAVRRFGGSAVDEVVQMRAWPSSSVLRIGAGGRVCYFKALPSSVVVEARVTKYLASHLPGFVPRLIAADLDRRWLLMEGFPGEALDAAPEPDRWASAARRYGDLQVATAEHIGALAAIGCPRRTVEKLAAELPSLMPDAAVATELQRRCEALERSPLPLTLEHGDLWPGNVLTDRATSVVIDWEDACIAPPLLGLAPLIVGLTVLPAATPAALERVQRAYLGAFDRYAPATELDELLRLALPLAFCDMALRYRQQRPSVASQHPWMRELVPEALARAKALL